MAKLRAQDRKASKKAREEAELEADRQADAFVNDEDEDEEVDEEDGPPAIDPYKVLGLQTEATADDVKKAYRKLALVHHPGIYRPLQHLRQNSPPADKAAPDAKDAANKKFQEIAFAYAVLSDDRRRKRYDLTGSTAETLEDDDDFNWLKFYREQFENVVSEEAISKLSDEYKGSAEERQHLLDAYNKAKGNLNGVYELVMLSDILEDDDRFRQILDEEIAKGTIDAFPIYARETDATRQKAKDAERKRREDYDKRQAEKGEAAATNGKANGKAKPTGKKAGGDMAGLAALIQQRQKSRAGGFFDHLEAKYAPKSRGSKRSTPMEEPPEEMFEANRAKKAKKSGRAKKAKDEEEDQMDLDDEDIGVSEDEEQAPRKSKSKTKAKGRGRASAKA
jgi:DnaJ family protein C protein 9